MTDRAPLYLIRCFSHGVCSAPQRLCDDAISAPSVGTREAMLLWPDRPPRNVLLVKKWRDASARDAAVEIADWLLEQEYDVCVWVVEEEGGIASPEDAMPDYIRRYQPPAHNRVLPFSMGTMLPYVSPPASQTVGVPKVPEMPCATASRTSTQPILASADAAAALVGGNSDSNGATALVKAVDGDASDCEGASPSIDVIISVGGDGTLLHLSTLFQEAMPPVIGIAFGSLGFMTPHSMRSCATLLHRIFNPAYFSKAAPAPPHSADTSVAEPTSSLQAAADGTPAASGSGLPAATAARSGGHDQPAPVAVSLRIRLRVDVYDVGAKPGCSAPLESRVVLNELLLERGPSPYMATLQAYVDDEPLTTVHADGLLIATQTGSTAYALSAGGSILSPQTAAINFVPICPHTLSFRPMLFPDSAVIRLEVPHDARTSVRCAFDGRNERDLTRGQFVVVQSSPWPLPLICRRTACGDWIRAIKNKLYWNVRLRQKPFAALQRADSIGEERVGTAIESEADNTYAASPLGFTQHAESAPSVPTVPSRTRAPSASSSEAYHLPRTLYRYWNPVPTTVPHRAPSSNVPVHTAQPLDESLASVTEPIAAVTSLSIDTTNERTGAEEQRMAVVERVPGVTPLRAVGITAVVAAAQGGAALSPISRSRSAWVCVPASDRRASTAPAADDVSHGESTQSRAEFCLEEEDPDEEDMVDQLEAELEHDSD